MACKPIINMQSGDLPKQILEVRNSNPNAKGITPTWMDLIDTLCLPSIFKISHQKESRRRSIKRLLDIQAYISMQYQCENYPLGVCALPIRRPAPHWTITLHNIYTTVKATFESPLNSV